MDFLSANWPYLVIGGLFLLMMSRGGGCCGGGHQRGGDNRGQHTDNSPSSNDNQKMPRQ